VIRLPVPDLPAIPAVELRPATWADDRPALQSVRRSVFVQEQGIPESEEWDDIDPVARHVLAVTPDCDAIGTGRLEPTGKVGRVAVLPRHRGAGVGRLIMRHLVNQATELGFTRVYLHAQTAAAGFYERLGFRADGPAFDEVGIPHVRMSLGITAGNGHQTGHHGHEEHPLDAR
jgi:predicted GNAT family N-acyltransferase